MKPANAARLFPTIQLRRNTMDWTKLGWELRESALDAHDGELPSINIAYSFLLENPECFGREDWPEDMPQEPNIELIAAYYAAGEAAIHETL